MRARGPIVEQYPRGANAYNALQEASGQDSELIELLRILNQAMSDTGVRPEKYEVVGDMILRLANYTDQAGKVAIDTKGYPGLDAILDTYDRFLELQT